MRGKGGERFRGKESIWEGSLGLEHVIVEGQTLEAKGLSLRSLK